MNTPPDRPDARRPTDIDEATQIRAWLRLREELAELTARLEVVKLMLKLGVKQR